MELNTYQNRLYLTFFVGAIVVGLLSVNLPVFQGFGVHLAVCFIAIQGCKYISKHQEKKHLRYGFVLLLGVATQSCFNFVGGALLITWWFQLIAQALLSVFVTGIFLMTEVGQKRIAAQGVVK